MGWFVFNNIILNDICVEEILKIFNINDIFKRRRLRYLNHIINLIIKIFFSLSRILTPLKKKLKELKYTRKIKLKKREI